MWVMWSHDARTSTRNKICFVGPPQHPCSVAATLPFALNSNFQHRWLLLRHEVFTDPLSWVDHCYQIRKRGVLIYAYANNHYAGHAPATIEQFRYLWHAKGLPELNKPTRMRPRESLLFE